MCQIQWIMLDMPGKWCGVLEFRIDEVELSYPGRYAAFPSDVLLQLLQGLTAWHGGFIGWWRVYTGLVGESDHWQLTFLSPDLCDIGASWKREKATVRRKELWDAVLAFAEQVADIREPDPGGDQGFEAERRRLLQQYLRMLLEWCHARR